MTDEWGEMIEPYGNDLPITESAPVVDFAAQMRALAAPPQKRKTKGNSSKKGKEGQGIAERALWEMGHLRVDGIPTPRRYVFHMTINKLPLFRMARMERANGDIYSMDKNGRWCLSEVKAYDKDRLQWSALTRQIKAGKYHQSENLDAHLALHPDVSAFLIWVRGKETAVLSWPIKGFKKGTSILWDDAIRDRVNK